MLKLAQMWEGFIFKSLAICIRFLERSQTTHGQIRAKNSILSVSASSFVTNLVSLFLDPGPKSSCYDIFLTAACKETSSSKEILTKLQNKELNLFKWLNCLSARYYWLQHQTKFQIFKQCTLFPHLIQVALTLDKIDNLQTPRSQFKLLAP